MKARKGEGVEVLLYSFTRRVEGGEWSTSAPATLPMGKGPGTHCTGGWVGFGTGMDCYGKCIPPPGFEARTVQPVARSYTDYAIPTAINTCTAM